MGPFSAKFKEGFWNALYEYFIITMPVGIYVILEASSHSGEWHKLYTSPEWAIATIFLSFVSLSKYMGSIMKAGKEVNLAKIGIFGLVILIIIIMSTINAKMSVEAETDGEIIGRALLFILSTFIFFVLMTGRRLLI